MTKTILATIIATFVTLAIPASASAIPAVEIVETGISQVSIIYANSILRVTGAEGETLQIYNVTGVRVMSVRVEGDDKRFELNLPKGCYIVKVGKYVRKIPVK